MSSPLETERLLLAPWGAADVALLRVLASDLRVVRYILDGAPWTEAKTAAVSHAMHEHWLAHGFGWRVALARGSGRAIGFIGLNHAGEGTAGVDPGEFEIGWWLEPASWGRGLASEGARAVSAEAFTRVGAASVIARLQPGNAASAGVAEGLGMALETETTGRVGEPVRVYRLRRDDWATAVTPPGP